MLHETTFEYLMPTDHQLSEMRELRTGFALLSGLVDKVLAEGADKDHVQRLLRTAGMWANVAVTRDASGAPREEVAQSPS